MRAQLKSLWPGFLKIPLWFWLLFSISMMGWSHLEKAREERACQQRRTQLDALNLDYRKLRRASDEHLQKGRNLVAKKPWTDADLAAAQDFQAESKRLDARAAGLEQRLNEICPPDNPR